jgi:phosphohistidine phosphatase SixA
MNNDPRIWNRRWRYAGLIVMTLIAVPTLYWYFCRGIPTTVLLVRHADRQGSADMLSVAGNERAQTLAHTLGKSGVNAIYTSEAARTQQTAAPTAGVLGVTPVAVAASNTMLLVSNIRNNNYGQKVLVVGHSETVPEIIAAFGGPAVTIDGNEYDNLYVLTLCRCLFGRVSLTNLQYGVASP